ncbi:MAG: hypothetical protein ACREV4_08215, partial [Gammaproteobacteria bacterium]
SMNTGEGGLSPYHLEGGCDIVFQMGTAKYGHFEKFHPWNFSHRKAKNASFALLHFSNSHLFEKWAAYPYAAGHFELIEVPTNQRVRYPVPMGRHGAANAGLSPTWSLGKPERG